MRFALTAEQQDLRAVVSEMMARLCPPAVVTAAVDTPEVGTLRAGLTDLGTWGLLVGDDTGGLGLDENHLVPVLAETGKAAAPLPLIDTVAFAPAVLEHAGMDHMLADVLSGSALCAADPEGADVVRYGHTANLQLRGGFGGTGTVAVYDIASASRETVEAVDPAANLVRVFGGTRVAVVDDPNTVEHAWSRGVLGAAAQLVGLARRMLDLTVEYVSARHQFGAPIGSFQAVKHHLASALLEVEFAEPTVAKAGWSLATGQSSAATDVSTAKALTSDAARTVAKAAIQCHGAIGYTTEYDLHLYAKRAWALAAEWGSAAWHRARVARTLGLPLTGTPPAH